MKHRYTSENCKKPGQHYCRSPPADELPV